MRPTPSAYLLAALLVAPAAAFGERTVTLCDSENPPYSIGKEDGTAAEGGVAVALAREVFSRLGDVDLQVRLMPWSRCLQEARTGAVDGVLKLLRNDERAEYLDFSAEPLYRMEVVFFYLAEKHPDGLWWTELSDLSELKLGVVAGSSSGPAVDAAIREGIFRTDSATADQQNILKLSRGRIDLFADDRIMGLANVRAEGLEGLIVPSDQVVGSQPIYIGISKKSDAVALLPEVSRILGELWADGTAERILESAPSVE